MAQRRPFEESLATPATFMCRNPKTKTARQSGEL